MKYNIEEPVLTTQDRMGDHYRHPAFGQLTVNRVNGHATLYDSDFEHQHYVTVQLHESKLCRSLARDWHFSGKTIMEINMSEAQWATFVSSFGQGGGVPCTIDRFNGESRPGLPPMDRTTPYKNEVKKAAADMVEELKRLYAVIAGDDKMSKAKKAELLGHVNSATSKATSTIPFIADSFDEHVEGTVEKAKAEVHGYMNATIQRAGLKALGAEEATPLLEAGEGLGK